MTARLSISRCPPVLVAVALVMTAAPATPAATITGNFVAPGDMFPSTIITAGAAPANTTGTGNLTDIFNAAAAVWQRIIGDSFTVTVDYGWANLSSGILATTTVDGTGGSPNRVTHVTTLFTNNTGTASYYLDPTPTDSSEWSSYSQTTADLGGGTLVTGRVYSGATSAAAGTGHYDLFTIAEHELGRALGLSAAYVGYTDAVSADNDIHVTTPRPFAGSVITTGGSANAYLTGLPDALMANAPAANGQRLLPSDADILAVDQVSQCSQVNLDAVPEPATLALLAVGLLMGSLPRRRHHAAADAAASRRARRRLSVFPDLQVSEKPDGAPTQMCYDEAGE